MLLEEGEGRRSGRAKNVVDYSEGSLYQKSLLDSQRSALPAPADAPAVKSEDAEERTGFLTALPRAQWAGAVVIIEKNRCSTPHHPSARLAKCRRTVCLCGYCS